MWLWLCRLAVLDNIVIWKDLVYGDLSGQYISHRNSRDEVFEIRRGLNMVCLLYYEQDSITKKSVTFTVFGKGYISFPEKDGNDE